MSIRRIVTHRVLSSERPARKIISCHTPSCQLGFYIYVNSFCFSTYFAEKKIKHNFYRNILETFHESLKNFVSCHKIYSKAGFQIYRCSGKLHRNYCWVAPSINYWGELQQVRGEFVRVLRGEFDRVRREGVRFLFKRGHASLKSDFTELDIKGMLDLNQNQHLNVATSFWNLTSSRLILK